MPNSYIGNHILVPQWEIEQPNYLTFSAPGMLEQWNYGIMGSEAICWQNSFVIKVRNFYR